MTVENIGLVLLFAWVFWALYVFTMGMYRAKLNGRLKGLNLLLGAPIVLVALVVDIVFNIFVATIMFLEPPRELLMTSRLQRLMVTDAGWRYRLAKALCDGVLDPFDPKGDHC